MSDDTPTCRNETGDPDLCTKYCADHEFLIECGSCKKLMKTTCGYLEVIGPYHSGCFGYPMCACPTGHKGDCHKT